MSCESNKSSKGQIRCKRKWSDSEVLKILRFIQEERDFENPTAQNYYKKCLQKTKIDATWDLVRWKVRYLKTTFKKAEAFINSKEARTLEAAQGIFSVKEKKNKICPYYDLLKDIFGEQPCPIKLELYDSDTQAIQAASISEDESLVSEGLDKMQTTPFSCGIPEDTPNVQQFVQNIKIEEPRPNLLSPKQSARHELQRIKLDMKNKKLCKELEIADRRLRLKKIQIEAQIERQRDELELRRLILEKDERIRILEIEKEERVQKYEIEMKYKYAKK